MSAGNFTNLDLMMRIDSLEQAHVAATDTTWLIRSGIGIISMQVGFAMLEAGAVRAKNAKSIMLKSISDATVGALVWYAMGFALFEGDGSFLGGGHGGGHSGDVQASSLFFLSTVHSSFFAKFFQQYGFAVAAATIVSGGCASRMYFGPYIIFSLLMVAFIYPVQAHWAWAESGWLNENFTFRDYAGSAVVHVTGGVAALVSAIIVGPRFGRFVRDNNTGKVTVREIPGHSATLYVLGSLLLFESWFSFNASGGGGIHSIEQATEASIATVNTLLAAATASTVMAAYGVIVLKVHSITYACNGLLGGLVAISGPCAFVDTWAAVVIGAIAALGVISFSSFLANIAHVDDPLDAVAVHAACGCIGSLATGLLASKGGLITTGDASLIFGQMVGTLSIVAWSAVMSLLVFGALKYSTGLRVPDDDQILGLDIIYRSGFAYPEFDVMAITEFNRQKELQRKRRYSSGGEKRTSFTESDRSRFSRGTQGLTEPFQALTKRLSFRLRNTGTSASRSASPMPAHESPERESDEENQRIESIRRARSSMVMSSARTVV